MRNRDDKLRKSSVEAATERVQQVAMQVLEHSSASSLVSPGRVWMERSEKFISSLFFLCCTNGNIFEQDSHNGGSLVGRKTLRAIRLVLDKYASRVTSDTACSHLLADGYSSQVTPLRFPSMLSKFRSPIESTPVATKGAEPEEPDTADDSSLQVCTSPLNVQCSADHFT